MARFILKEILGQAVQLLLPSADAMFVLLARARATGQRIKLILLAIAIIALCVSMALIESVNVTVTQTQFAQIVRSASLIELTNQFHAPQLKIEFAKPAPIAMVRCMSHVHAHQPKTEFVKIVRDVLQI